MLYTTTVISVDDGLLSNSTSCAVPASSLILYVDWLNVTVTSNDIVVFYYTEQLRNYQTILLVSSVITPAALVILLGITWPLSEGGIIKVRSNVSDCSAILSLVIGTLIVVLVELAAKVAVIGVEI